MTNGSENENLLREFTALALHPRHGVRLLRRAGLDAGLAGAVLAELAVTGRIDLADGDVVVVDPSPSGSVTDAALGEIGTYPARRPEWWVRRIRSRRLWDDAREDLAAAGIVVRRRPSVLGPLRARAYPAADPAYRDSLVERVRAVLIDGTGDARAEALAALVLASGLAPRIVKRPSVRIAAETERSSWVARAVHAVVTDSRARTTTITAAGGAG